MTGSLLEHGALPPSVLFADDDMLPRQPLIYHSSTSRGLQQTRSLSNKHIIKPIICQLLIIRQRSLGVGTAQSALHFTQPNPCSFLRHLKFSGKLSTTMQLLHEDYLFTYPPSIGSYSFIQLSELWQCGLINIAKVSKQLQEDSYLGSIN